MTDLLYWFGGDGYCCRPTLWFCCWGKPLPAGCIPPDAVPEGGESVESLVYADGGESVVAWFGENPFIKSMDEGCCWTGGGGRFCCMPLLVTMGRRGWWTAAFLPRFALDSACLLCRRFLLPLILTKFGSRERKPAWWTIPPWCCPDKLYSSNKRTMSNCRWCMAMSRGNLNGLHGNWFVLF